MSEIPNFNTNSLLHTFIPCRMTTGDNQQQNVKAKILIQKFKLHGE